MDSSNGTRPGAVFFLHLEETVGSVEQMWNRNAAIQRRLVDCLLELLGRGRSSQGTFPRVEEAERKWSRTKLLNERSKLKEEPAA